MPDAPTKLQRWLDLISYLAGRRYPVSTDELWAAIPAYAPGVGAEEPAKGAVRRQFERDKDELRALGIPIETVKFSINYGREEQVGYRLQRRDFHLPYLKLLRKGGGEGDEGEGTGSGEGARPGGAAGGASPAGVFEMTEAEAGAALQGLGELASLPAFPLVRAARGAFRKLAFDLDPGVVGRSSVVYARDPEAEASGEKVRELSEAVRRRKRVTMRYRAISTDSEAEREILPFGLLFQHGRWYLIGHDTGRDAVRMYRVGRIVSLSVNRRAPASPDYEVPADFSLVSYAGRSAWELDGDEDPTEAEVLFRFPRSLWAQRNGHGALVAEEPDGAQLRRFTVHRRDPFLRWVLSLAGDARVAAPDELREEFRRMVARVVEAHGGAEEAPLEDVGSAEEVGAPEEEPSDE